MGEGEDYARAGRPAPVEIRLITADNRLEVDFADGRRFALPAEYLRVESPSAEVQGHGPDERQWIGGKADIAITAIEPVGEYAVRLRFSDGHDSGIFSWAWLYYLGLRQSEIWPRYLDAIAARGLSRR